MTVLFYSGFYKRRNSTKQPSGGTAKTVALKEGTSMMKPEFLVSTVDWSWNYAHWGARYYYVIDIVAEANELFRVKCELDVLATFRADIGGYSTLISRSDTSFNSHVMETIYPSKSLPYTLSSSISTAGVFSTNRNSGTIVVGIMGTGGLDFYIMSVSQFEAMCYVVFPSINQPPNVYFSSAIAEAMVGGLNSVLQAFVLLKWLPIDYTFIVSQLGLTAAPNMYVGQIYCDLSGANVYKLTGNTIITVAARNFTFPSRTAGRITQMGDWLYMQPFANYTLSAPPFGLITVDGSFLLPASMGMQAIIRVEILSGNAILDLKYTDTTQKPCGKYHTCVAYDIKAGGTGGANLLGGLGNAASAVASFITKDYVGAAGSLLSATQAMIPQAGQMGAGVGGPVPDMCDMWYAYATYYDPIEENRTELGRPLAEVKTINTLSGYVQCADANLAIPGHAEEMVEVNNLLNSGIFYE